MNKMRLRIAEEIGFPVIIKATAGGGGKGIRVARDEEELINGIKITQKEAAAAFGNPGIYPQKFIEVFRHIEVQILADKHGNTIHLGERDCSIQRRMQKLVEEGTLPALTPELRLGSRRCSGQSGRSRQLWRVLERLNSFSIILIKRSTSWK